MEQKDRHALEAEFAGQLAQPIDILFHRVADKDQGVDPLLVVLGDGMRQHAFDLGLAAEAGHSAHRPVQGGGIGHPAARLAFVEAAVIDELDVEPAEGGGGLEHLALDAAGAVPCRFAARGGVEREDQPAAATGRPHRRRALQIAQEGVDLGRARFLGKLIFVSAHPRTSSPYPDLFRAPTP